MGPHPSGPVDAVGRKTTIRKYIFDARPLKGRIIARWRFIPHCWRWCSWPPIRSRAPRFDAAAVEFFEKKVRPVLVGNCYTCHSADTNSKGGLRVDDRNGLIQGGNSGPAVVPGEPDESLLIQAVRHADETPKMPPKKQLSAEQIADLTTSGSRTARPGPTVETVPVALGKPNPKYDKLRKEHWAWQPLERAKLPAGRDAAWPRDDIDRFVLAQAGSEGAEAGRRRRPA